MGGVEGEKGIEKTKRHLRTVGLAFSLCDCYSVRKRVPFVYIGGQNDPLQ
jgi:hypothetical protein